MKILLQENTRRGFKRRQVIYACLFSAIFIICVIVKVIILSIIFFFCSVVLWKKAYAFLKLFSRIILNIEEKGIKINWYNRDKLFLSKWIDKKDVLGCEIVDNTYWLVQGYRIDITRKSPKIK